MLDFYDFFYSLLTSCGQVFVLISADVLIILFINESNSCGALLVEHNWKHGSHRVWDLRVATPGPSGQAMWIFLLQEHLHACRCPIRKKK